MIKYVNNDEIEEEGVLEGLAEVARGRRDVDEHERLGVAAERVLEEVRELRVAVGHVFVAVRERLNAIAEVRERTVDGDRLLERRARRAALVEALGAGEVDEVQQALDLLLVDIVATLNHSIRTHTTPLL